MATVDVPWEWFVFRMRAYLYIVKVTKFEFSTGYCFSTADGRTRLRADAALPPPPPPACLGLNFGVLLQENLMV